MFKYIKRVYNDSILFIIYTFDNVINFLCINILKLINQSFFKIYKIICNLRSNSKIVLINFYKINDKREIKIRNIVNFFDVKKFINKIYDDIEKYLIWNMTNIVIDIVTFATFEYFVIIYNYKNFF